MRRFLVGLCLFLGTLFVIVGNISNSARHQLLDTQTFVTNANTIVQSPPVQSAVTKQVSDAVFAQSQVQQAINAAEADWLPKEFNTFKPQIEAGIHQGVNAAIGYIVGSSAFQKVYTAALTATHERLVSGKGLTFDVGDVKQIVGADKASGIVGQAVALIPNDIASVSLLNPKQTQQLNQAISILGNLWWWSWLVGLILLGVAIGISHRRLKTVRALGVTLGVIALVFIVVFSVARGQVLAAVPVANRGIVQSVWDVIVPPYVSRLIWLLVLGVVVIIVTSLWGRLGLVEGVRKAFRASRDKLAESRAHAATGEAAGAGGAAVAPAGAEGGAGAVTAEGGAAMPEKLGWRDRVEVFANTIDFDAALGGAAARVNRSLQAYRGVGVVVAALILLFWPSPTTGVLIWILALLVLYLGGIELLLGLGGQKKGAATTAPAGVATAEAPPAEAVEAPTGSGAAGGVVAFAAPSGSSGASGPTGWSGPAEAGRAAAVAVPDAPITAPQPAPEPALPISRRVELLERLGKARDSGLLTAEEFDAEKQRLLTS